jgi:hypothetical protein
MMVFGKMALHCLEGYGAGVFGEFPPLGCLVIRLLHHRPGTLSASFQKAARTVGKGLRELLGEVQLHGNHATVRLQVDTFHF